VPRQCANQKMPPTEWRPLSTKMKHDASKTLGERTKKQHDTPIALQVGYKEHQEQPLSGRSHTRRDLFGFVPPPSLRRTQASTDQKYYNCVEIGHLTHLCP
jgi:hypothetical protein